MSSNVDAVNGAAHSLPPASDSASRGTYRHGDLRRALLDAGRDLARTGGPDGVTLRQATRRAGVSPNAAYRHFADRDALVAAVSERCLAEVAAEMMREIARSERAEGPAADHAASELDAVGRAYVHYALREPGLFRTAFTVHAEPGEEAGRDGSVPGPYGLLVAALDHAAATGARDPARRPGAEALAWSSVHGLAILLLEGPLRSVPAAQHDALIDGVLRMVREGLFTP